MPRGMILLVSEQPMPNLLAAAERSFDLAEVALVESPERRAAGERLDTLLSNRGLKVRHVQVETAFATRPTAEAVRAIVAAEPHHWIVNITGGTKLMSIGAAAAAHEAGARDILYIDHAKGLGHWAFGNRRDFAVQPRLSLSEILKAHNWMGEEARRPEADEIALAETMLAAVNAETRQLWNILMVKVEQASRQGRGQARRWSPEPVDTNGVEGPHFWTPAQTTRAREGVRALCRAAAEAKAARFDGTNLEVDEDSFAFLSGGWLEVAVWDTFDRRKGELGLDDILINAKIRSSDGAHNEIDVLALQGRRMIIIECKTVRLTGKDVAQKGDSIVYKLEFLKRLGGLKTLPVLVSLDAVSKHQEPRFVEAGIALVDGVTAETLDAKLTKALSPEPAPAT